MARLAEVREPDAPPAIAETYRQIKAASGMPQLNLIWRHFATEPEVLEWAWRAMAESLRSGAIAQAALDLTGDLAAMTSAPVWTGLGPEPARGVEDLMRFYTRGNTQNLIGLTGLLMWERGAAAAADPSAAKAMQSTQVQLPDVPPLPKRDALAPATLDLVDRLAGRHGGAELGVTPSMYLHLAIWPEALAAVDARLGTLVGSNGFTSEVDRVIAAGQAHAAQVAATYDDAAPRPPEAVLRPMMATLENFVTRTIPEMIVVGQVLRGAEIADHG
jgi:hypothetical protein